MNRGMKAHDHGMNVMSLLYHEYWNFDLLTQIKDELKKSAVLMEEHLEKFKCKCGDTIEEIAFYKDLAAEIERAIKERDWFVVPWVQEQLHRYVNGKQPGHKCMTHLVNTKHNWLLNEPNPL